MKKKVVAVSRVTLNESLLSLEVGKTFTLIATITPDNATDKSVVWSSSDESIAAVKNGVVTAKVAGTAIITAAAGDEEATCVVTVVNPASVNTPVVVNGKLIVYDLIGRKMQVEHLDELPVGVYVINGQKVVIK